jgi:hypothetical protein
MALSPINPTQITPPRVEFIDPRSGAISREWYRFFLSLRNATQENQEEVTLSTDTASLMATYDALLATVAQASDTASESMVPSLESSIDNLQNAFGVTPPDLGGTVTSVAASGGTTGLTFTGSPITTSGTLTLGGTLVVANGGTGASTFTANALLKGNGTSAVSTSNVSDNGSTVSIATGIGFSVARTAVTSPAAADGNVFSGTYTPTSFNTTNIAASTPQSAQYMRVGNTVTVSGQIDIDPTATGFAILGLSLPIASNLTSPVQLSGVFNCPDAAGGGVYGDAANDRATFQFTATSASNLTYYYTFTYQVL